MNKPSSLVDLQNLIQNAVEAGASPAALLPQLLEKPPVPIAARLQIYKDAYSTRMTESLHDDFPRTRADIGDESFTALVTEFVRQTPSQVRNLAEYSADFPAFVRTRHPQSYATAQKEWLTILSDHARDPEDALLAEEVQGGTPFRLRLHPASVMDEERLAFRRAGETRTRDLLPAEAPLLRMLMEAMALQDFADRVQRTGLPEEDFVSFVSAWLADGIVYCERNSI